MRESPRVLVVDDEPMVLDVLTRYLAREGFGVDTAEDGEAAMAKFEANHPDLVLLDLMLPRLDGLEVFRRIRDRNTTAVIMLSAKGEETDRVVGLELGADDYITKPFSPREVVARVRAVLRRGHGGPAPPAAELLTFDGLEDRRTGAPRLRLGQRGPADPEGVRPPAAPRVEPGSCVQPDPAPRRVVGLRVRGRHIDDHRLICGDCARRSRSTPLTPNAW